METTLTSLAQERQYTEFDKQVKATLSQKVAEKLQADNYFDRLDTAQGVGVVETPSTSSED